MRSGFASSSSSRSFDLTVATSFGLDYVIAYLSDHGHGLVVVLQVLKVQLGQFPSFAGMEHGALHCT